jgi:hypothetical protein
MPRLLNVRTLPGYARRPPVIPEGAVYIGRAYARYRLEGSRWANEPLPQAASHEERAGNIAAYEARLRCDPVRMAQLPELEGRDLYCWCAPLPCHGDVLLKLLAERRPTQLR